MGCPSRNGRQVSRSIPLVNHRPYATRHRAPPLPPLRDKRFWITQALVMLVSVAHLLLHLWVGGTPEDIVGIAYAIPMIYAALEFGFGGAVATTAFVTVLLAPYIIDDLFTGQAVDFAGHVSQLAILGITAPVVGRVVERERKEHYAHEAAELRYRAFFDTSGVPAVVLDEAGNVQEANPAAAGLLRGAPEGRSLADFLGNDTAEALLGPDPPTRLHVAEGLELRPVISRPKSDEGERLTQVLFQDVTEEAGEHRRARAWALAVLSAQEDERRRLSRELHDEALQLVVELRRQVERAAKSVPGASEKLVAPRELADEIIDELRTVAVRLRPPDLDDLGLVASLKRLVAEARKRGFGVGYEVEEMEHVPPPPIALALYRVAQEALTNAERHTHAEHAFVQLSAEPGGITLSVKDNGVGFDLEKVEAATDNVHLGLLGMRERVQIVGGALEIMTAPGDGTKIVAWVPC